MQNLAPGGFSVAQLGQLAASVDPHDMQNRARSGFWVPQLGQAPPATCSTLHGLRHHYVRCITYASAGSSRLSLDGVGYPFICFLYPGASDRPEEEEQRLSRLKALVATLVIAVPIPAAIAGCGGGSSSNDEDPQQVLTQTFDNSTKVTSGNLNISLSGSAEGTTSGSLTATIDGPFQSDESNPNAFPQLDLTGKVTAEQAGQSFSFDGSLIATDDNAYVEYQGQAYEVGTALFEKFARAYERQAAQAQGGQDNSSFFKQFGINPDKWLTNVSNEGTTDVDGTETIHVHGDADVPQIVSDLQKAAQQAPGSTATHLSPQQIDQIQSAIKSATVDVYSGTDDKVLRKLALALTIEPPAGTGSSVSSVDVNFSVTVSDVNSPQTISPPDNAKPLRDLLSQFGISNLPLGSLGQ
jgi:hypothetical protein